MRGGDRQLRLIMLGAAAAALGVAGCRAAETPPPRVTAAAATSLATQSVVSELQDAKRSKLLTIRVTYPQAPGRYPLIVFSHGAGGSGDNYLELTRHWAEHGYVVVQPTHIDSRRALGRMPGPDELSRWGERPLDVSLVLDSLDTVEQRLGIVGRIDRERIGVGGHSMGAQTSQLIGGVLPGSATPYARTRFRDERADAILVLSGQGAGREFDERSWKGLLPPMLVITGTNDTSVSAGRDSNWRREPFDRAPPGSKYLLFIDGAYHGFGGISGARSAGANAGPPNPAHVAMVKASTLRFWDAYLKGDKAAMQALGTDRIAAEWGGQATMASK